MGSSLSRALSRGVTRAKQNLSRPFVDIIGKSRRLSIKILSDHSLEYRAKRDELDKRPSQLRVQND